MMIKPLKLAVLSIVLLNYVVTATAAPDPIDFGKSLGQGIDVTTPDGQNIQMPNGESLDSEQFKGAAEHPDQQTMVDQAKNSSGDADALQDLEHQMSKDLAGTTTYDNHQSRAFDITLNSVATDTGEREIESYGCTITRASHNDMSYNPFDSAGSQISGDNITIDQDTCQPTYTDRFGAQCEIIDSQTTCTTPSNTRVVRGDMEAWDTINDKFVPLSDSAVAQLPHCGGNHESNSNLFNNPGFEQPSVLSSNNWTYISSSDLPGWTGVPSYTELQNQEQAPNYKGSQVLELNAEGSNNTVWQTVPTIPGVAYVVSVWHHAVKKPWEKIKIDVVGNTFRIFEVGTKTQWIKHQMEFTANGSSEKIRFIAHAYKSHKKGNLIDEAMVYPQYCKKRAEIQVTPSVAQTELAPLFQGDPQSPVCWQAGSEAVCTVQTAVKDPLMEQIANDSFDQAVIDQSILEAFGDCSEQEVSETTSSTVDFTSKEYCGRSITPTISGCSLSRSIELNGSLEMTDDKWSGSTHCELIESRLQAYGSECTYSVDYDSPQCASANNGVQICSPSHISSQGVDISVCGGGRVNVNSEMASDVAFLGSGDVGMCAVTDTTDCTTTSADGNMVCVKDQPLSLPVKTSKSYSQLGDSISLGAATSPDLTISDIECSPPTDSGCTNLTDANGDSFQVCGGFDTSDECASVLSQDGCTVSSTRCIDETGHGLVCESAGNCFDQLCFREEVTVDCVQPKTYEDEVTRIEMSCSDSTYHCIDGSCFDEEPEINSDFGRAAAMLSAAEGIGTHMSCEDESDPTTCRVFGGEYASCRKATGPAASLFNCCDISGGSGTLHKEDYIAAVLGAGVAYSGWALDSDITAVVGATASMVNAAKAVISFLFPCRPQEYEIAMGKETDSLIYLGKDCGKSISAGFSTICMRRDSHYCKFDSPLGRILMEQAALQLEDGSGNLWRNYSNPQKDQAFCDGMTLNQITSLDWDRIDLGEWEHMMRESNNMPPAECATMDFQSGGCSGVDQRDFDVDPTTQNPANNPGGVDEL